MVKKARQPQRNTSMMKELLERAIKKEGGVVPLSTAIGCSQGFISHMRTGRKPIPAEVAVKLAELLGERGVDYIIPALLEAAQTDEKRKFWNHQLLQFQRLIKASGAAAAVFIVIASITHSSPTMAAERLSAGLTGKFPYVSVGCHCRTRRKYLIKQGLVRVSHWLSRIIGHKKAPSDSCYLPTIAA